MKAYLRLAMATIGVVTVTTTFCVAADEAPATPAPTEQTPAVQAPPAASAEEVKALKKQNVELQQRLDKLSGEMDQIKSQLAEKQKPVVAQPPTKKPATGILDLEIFTEEIFMRDVYTHFLNVLGITKAEMRGPRVKKSLVTS